MPTRRVSASWGLGAIQRTCEVQGRGGKLPRRSRGQLQQRLELPPVAATVVAAIQPARLGAGVDGAVGRADSEREYARLGEVAVDSRLPAIGRAAHPALSKAGVDRLGIAGIDGEALGAASPKRELNRPLAAALREPGDPVAGGGVEAGRLAGWARGFHPPVCSEVELAR